MNRIVSPYYPPRARWYRPVFSVGQALRRCLRLDRRLFPERVPVGAFMASLFVPGLVFSARGERRIGRAVLFVYGLLGIIFFVWLGYPVANLAFGLMLSAHVTSIIFLLNPWLLEARFGFRIATGLILLLVVGGGLYAPLRNELQTKFLLPLRIQGNVVVIQIFSSPRSIRRGDWVAYSRESLEVGDAHREGGAVQVQAGYGFGAVLGVAGDRIRFTPHSFELNGVAQKSLSHMPIAGEFVVPEKNWFIWPEFVITGHENAPEATIATALLQLATVPKAQFIGKPFKRWFGRRQILA